MPVPGAPLRLPDVLLQDMPYDGPVGQPVRQPRAHQRIGVEQLELTAESAVVVHGVHGAHGVLPRGGGRRTDGNDKARGTRPGASDCDSCQRTGTCSGVVVIEGMAWARCMG